MPRQRIRKLILQFAPFLFLLLFFVLYNLLPSFRSASLTPGSPSPPPVAAQPDSANTRAPAATATPSPVPAATRTPEPTATFYPTAVPDAALTMLGPPPGAVVATGYPVILYWSWTETLLPDQLFFIQIRSSTEEQQLGPLSARNLGELYQLQLPPLPAGEYLWSVQLHSTELESVLFRSEERALQLIQN